MDGWNSGEPLIKGAEGANRAAYRPMNLSGKRTEHSVVSPLLCGGKSFCPSSESNRRFGSFHFFCRAPPARREKSGHTTFAVAGGGMAAHYFRPAL